MTDIDHLSDEDAERMDRAYNPVWWAMYDDRPRPLEDEWGQSRTDRLERIRRAWAARPATARDLDGAAMSHAIARQMTDHSKDFR